MSAHRFFLTGPLSSGDAYAVTLPLSDADVHHAASVLRLRAGEVIEVVEPAGAAVWTVRLSTVGAEGLSGVPLEHLERAEQPRVSLVQGVAKGDKMDSIVRQAVEIGASRIIPVLTERSVVRLDARKAADKGERWRRVARSAAEQSHRDVVPTVDDPLPLRDATALLAEHDVVVVLWEDAAGTGLARALAGVAQTPDTRVALVVGPEGGLSAEEVERLTAAGAHVAGLGPHILRTETAAVAGLALVIHLLGGLGAEPAL